MTGEISQNPDDYRLTFETLKKLCVDQDVIDVIRDQISDWHELNVADEIERGTLPYMPAAFLQPNMARRSGQLEYFEKECACEDPAEASEKLYRYARLLRNMAEY